jgi:cupin domain
VVGAFQAAHERAVAIDRLVQVDHLGLPVDAAAIHREALSGATPGEGRRPANRAMPGIEGVDEGVDLVGRTERRSTGPRVGLSLGSAGLTRIRAAGLGVGDREVPVTAGGLVFVPRGTAHTVWNSGDRPVRGLILVSPGGAEHVFVPVEAG